MGHAFAGLGLVFEYLAHGIKAIATPLCDVPVEVTAVAVGPGARGREMEYTAFIDRVQQRMDVASQAEAVRATHATLETLGERLSTRETRQLAAELPKELRAYLLQRSAHQPFLLEEFFNRVSARVGVRWHQAAAQARAVMAVVGEAVSSGELEDVRTELAPDYDALFEEAT
jgi:uncharacterized protein (DUF2267 family)